MFAISRICDLCWLMFAIILFSRLHERKVEFMRDIFKMPADKGPIYVLLENRCKMMLDMKGSIKRAVLARNYII